MVKITEKLQSSTVTGLYLRELLKPIPFVTFVATVWMMCSPIPVYAEPVCIEITADVAVVDDRENYLKGAIKVGDIITGTYDYESTTQDTNPLSTVGDYWHTDMPYGITINAGGYVFRTDPNNVNFLVEIVNDHPSTGTPRDNYLLRSYNNIFDIAVPSETHNHISWQLDDSTATALSSEALPTTPPTLSDWDSIFGLTITSENYATGDWIFVRAHVTSAYLCGESPSQEVAICHKPGTTAQKTLYIPNQAVDGHLRHGDALGACY